ncbi:receptor-type tyrosine-protein phosphatase O-like [Ptychodera flava]|uniref:receptor-type tyrosine-protein phosphatase O-like n=1 Tax=Ptychodera flava TaxID=63121 RepID=UPI00396A31BB
MALDSSRHSGGLLLAITVILGVILFLRKYPDAFKRKRPVKLSEYDDYFNTMSADIEFLFSEEYKGNNSPKEFIATQGPLPETNDDFWRMIWEYNVKTVVMLTECTERGKVKCDHYWPPDNEPVHYGDIQVNIVSEEMFAEWTLKEFNLENGGRNKRVRHFNFTAWSDYGVPEATQPLLHFVRAVREQIPDYIHPVIVHCSSGVGRTGTFVALDRLIQHMRDNDYVDIYGIACEMRMHRMYMIQTESQYVFIHQCVADLLHEEVERGEDNFPSPQFHEHTYGNVSPIRAAKSDIVANYGM